MTKLAHHVMLAAVFGTLALGLSADEKSRALGNRSILRTADEINVKAAFGEAKPIDPLTMPDSDYEAWVMVTARSQGISVQEAWQKLREARQVEKLDRQLLTHDRDNYAGIRIDRNNRNATIFLFKHDGAQILARRAQEAGVPIDSSFRVETVTYSLADIEQANTQISGAIEAN